VRGRREGNEGIVAEEKGEEGGHVRGEERGKVFGRREALAVVHV
jgi:hypothetical protein